MTQHGAHGRKVNTFKGLKHSLIYKRGVHCSSEPVLLVQYFDCETGKRDRRRESKSSDHEIDCSFAASSAHY